MPSSIELAPGAEENGLASMLANLVRQNLESKPHKRRDLEALSGSVAIVADDADVALTLSFDEGTLTIHDGIVGIPDVTLRGDSETIMSLSNTPLVTRFGLPFAHPRDKEGAAVSRAVTDAIKSGRFHIYGLFLHVPMMLRLTRVMSVNG